MSNDRKSAVQPGVYPDAIADDYHRWDALSSTRMKWMERSPAYCRYMIDHPQEPTDAMRLGTACHFAVLEPGQFEARYVTAGQCAAVKKDKTRCRNDGHILRGGAWYCGVRGHAPEPEQDEPQEFRSVLRAEEYAKASAIRDAVAHHKQASELLYGGGVDVEESFVWKDPYTGLMCKGRPDAHAAHGLIDLKVTRDAHPLRIERFIGKMGLHRQLAFYMEGLRANGHEPAAQYIVAVEPEPPHEVYVYKAHADMIRAGERHVEMLRQRYARCVKANHWPEDDNPHDSVSIPNWLHYQLFPEENPNVSLSVGGERIEF